jgi:hypothetical protein
MRRTKKPGAKKRVAAKKQVGAYIDVDLYKLVKGYAGVQDRRVGDVISDAIQEYLDKRDFTPGQGS